MTLTRQQYARAFALNFIFYIIAIVVYIGYSLEFLGGVSVPVIVVMLAGSVALVMRGLRQMEPVTQRLQFSDRDYFLKMFSYTMTLKDRWTLAEETNSTLRYTARLNYGLYFHPATLEVELLEDMATVVGPPRMVRYITPLLVRTDAAKVMESRKKRK